MYRHNDNNFFKAVGLEKSDLASVLYIVFNQGSTVVNDILTKFLATPVSTKVSKKKLAALCTLIYVQESDEIKSLLLSMVASKENDSNELIRIGALIADIENSNFTVASQICEMIEKKFTQDEPLVHACIKFFSFYMWISTFLSSSDMQQLVSEEETRNVTLH